MNEMIRLNLKLLSIITLLVCTISCKKDLPGDPIAETCSGGDGILCTVAGRTGEAGGGGNGGAAVDAKLYWVTDLTIDQSGNLYLVDFNNHCVRKIGTNGIITNFMGSGYLGDDATGHALNVNLNHPTEFHIDANGDYWLVAWHNWKLKKISASDLSVSSPVGTSQGFGGDGGPASLAKLNLPSSMVFTANGDIIMCDQANQRIRKVDINTMTINTIAGSSKGYADGVGTAAQFSLPEGSNAEPGGKIALSHDGQWLYIADTENHRIRKMNMTTFEVTTIAGTGVAGHSGDGGSALQASLNYPIDIAVANDNTIYIADTKNHCVRRISPDGIINTVAGIPTQAGKSTDGKPATSSQLNHPRGLCLTADNVLYIADTYNNRVVKVENP